MPTNKNALARYQVIDSCLTNKQKKYPKLADLQNKIDERLGIGEDENGISDSTVKNDIKAMKKLWNAFIDYNRERRGYYYTEENFSIKQFPSAI